MDKHIIPARVYPNTEKGYADAVEFDAYAWFEQATDAQIAALDMLHAGTDEQRVALNQIAIACDQLSPEALNDPRGWRTDILGSALGKYLVGRKMLAWLEKKVAFGYVTKHAFEERYPGVIFTDSGATRFAFTAGWIVGVARGDRKVGLTLAREFDLAFQNLSSDLVDYEVRSQYRPDVVDGTVQVRRGKVVVNDDGTFGGFGIVWYYPLRSNAIREKAIEIDPAAYTSEDGSKWCRARDAAKEALHVRTDLQESRHYWPSYDVVTEGVETSAGGEGVEAYSWPIKIHSAGTMSHVFVDYAFAYNGAMIYRGPGRTAEPFCVNLGSDDRLWTVHT